jgi:hypothetical protein
MSDSQRESFLHSKQYHNLCEFTDWITKRHHDCGGVTEIRILRGNRAYIGWFDYDHQKELLEAILPTPSIRKKIPYGDYPRIGEANIYFSLQVVDPDLLARSAYCFSQTSATSDNDILAYHLFAIDIDPVRKSGISSSDVEKQAVYEIVVVIKKWLSEQGIEALLADSGNGYHLLVPTIPYKGEHVNEAAENIHVLLQLLDRKFSTDKATVDTTVYNPSRIFKLYGTKAIKGSDLPSRPHRWANIDLTNIPEDIDLFKILRVDIEQFKKEINTDGTTEEITTKSDGWDRETCIKVLEGILQLSGLKYKRKIKGNRELFRFEKCPYHIDDDGDTYECCVMVESNGGFSGSCKHDDSAGWQEFKSTIGWDKHIQSVKQRLGLAIEQGRKTFNEPHRGWELPAPLGQFDLPKFPLEAFPRQLCVLCAFCAAVAESFQVPVDLPAMLVLSVAGASLAKRVIVHVRADHREPVNLYTVIALPPANRKSQVFRTVTEPLVYFERQETERLAPIIEQNRNQQIILEESLKHARREAAKAKTEDDRKSCKEQASKFAEELGELEVITSPQYVGDDATPESVALLLNDNCGRFALLSPEGDVFDLMAGRYSSNGTPNIGVYLKGHAGDDIRINRANKDFPPRYVQAPALSIGVTVQPEVLRGLTLKRGFRGRGLLARFLYSLPQSLLGHRKINPSPVDQEIARAYKRQLLDALRLEPNIDTNGKPCPHIVTFGSDALQEIDRFALEIEKHLGPGGDLSSMGDWAGKLVGAACRIAGIFHGLIHAASGNPAKAQIDAETMLGAIAIGEYLIPHAKAAFFEMGADPDIDTARKILEWASSEQKSEFTRRDTFNALRGNIQKVDELEKPLEILISHGYIRDISQDRYGPGRKPSPRYKINPLWLAQNTQNAQNCLTTMNSAYSAQFAQEISV